MVWCIDPFYAKTNLIFWLPNVFFQMIQTFIFPNWYFFYNSLKLLINIEVETLITVENFTRFLKFRAVFKVRYNMLLRYLNKSSKIPKKPKTSYHSYWKACRSVIKRNWLKQIKINLNLNPYKLVFKHYLQTNRSVNENL